MGNFVLRYTQYTIYLSNSNKTSKPTALPYLCEANPLVTGRFPAQSARFTESVPMPWRHHGMEICIWELLSWSNHKIHLFGKLPDWLYLMFIHGDCITQWHTPCLLTMFELLGRWCVSGTKFHFHGYIQIIMSTRVHFIVCLIRSIYDIFTNYINNFPF